MLISPGKPGSTPERKMYRSLQGRKALIHSLGKARPNPLSLLRHGSISAPDSPTKGLRVAIVGSGPSGFYTCKYLLQDKAEHAVAEVTVIDRLPTPFGLVRYGVAPDHPEVKNVEDDFSAVARQAGDRFRFIGNLELGDVDPSNATAMASRVSLEELRSNFDAVVLAYGADDDRPLGIPGEKLEGVLSARAFVGWYNGHPDFAHLTATITAALQRRPEVVVLGQGNVALDVARILLKATAANKPGNNKPSSSGGDDDGSDGGGSVASALAATDIASHAIEALAVGDCVSSSPPPPPSPPPSSPPPQVSRVSVVGRRGAAQVAFTIKELRELVRMKPTAVVETLAKEFELGETEASVKEVENTRPLKRLYALIKDTVVQEDDEYHAGSDVQEGNESSSMCSLRFLLVPQAIEANDPAHPGTVSSVRFSRAHLEGEPGRQKAVTMASKNDDGGGWSHNVVNEDIKLKCGLLLSAIGWRSYPACSQLPFDQSRGVVPTISGGRVVNKNVSKEEEEEDDDAEEEEEEVMTGLYAAGWLRRGPSGIIGTNIADGREVAAAILTDFASTTASSMEEEEEEEGSHNSDTKNEKGGCDALLSLVKARVGGEGGAARLVDWAGHERLSAEEVAAGKLKGKPREKFVSVQQMVDAARMPLE